ncbi:MAG: biopolymer transporter ExbD [Desulfobacteraceae bacterium]|jgi:biopolymer transport protein ExbD|nr:biopolymer transporter ExbD [Desulfobacteraceae bacterium]MDH3574961.1 biopolymer transporter ExbD [Desulfobacteraceae bacterium]MDH3722935.1 biopolymer transporter ExbD [Desulfobacteraceae bacterium]MDH3838871.1 biopolymer transporter ExbD [Desulfobacteraceae bacterium]MDH3874912.1 biopolymer transporter ExbD [Desulfobacteraceae bacterium]
MAMFSKKRRRYTVKMPLTPLIDIVFLLLIYFLLTTNFMVDEGIKIKLPQAKASAPQKEQEITVYIDKDGRTYLENQQIPLEVLFEKLRNKISRSDNDLVVLRADRAVIINKVVKVMDVCKAAGAGRLCLATEKGL